MEYARDAAQKAQNNVDPKGIIDPAIFHINPQRWNENCCDYLQSFVIHCTFSSKKIWMDYLHNYTMQQSKMLQI